MSSERFESGERVRHATFPEWGIGTIVKVEAARLNGMSSQRLSIRFPNGGLKTLITGHAELQRISDSVDPLSATIDAPMVKDWDKLNGSGWLSQVAKKKIEEAMISLPQEVRDPFNSLARRLQMMLALYRFDRSGRGLIDWAVAQTGLDDPLTRFTRHDLEQRFDRWVYERDNYLAKLLQDARQEPGALQAVLKDAPAAAQDAVRRLSASR